MISAERMRNVVVVESQVPGFVEQICVIIFRVLCCECFCVLSLVCVVVVERLHLVFPSETGFSFTSQIDCVKLHSHGNGRQRKQIYDCLKGLHTCKIHTDTTVVIQKIIIFVFFYNFLCQFLCRYFYYYYFNLSRFR